MLSSAPAHQRRHLLVGHIYTLSGFAGVRAQGRLSGGFGPQHDSDTFVVPSIHATIPFSQAPISRGSPPLAGDCAAPLSAPPTSLPQIIDKDWELNLDALEVGSSAKMKALHMRALPFGVLQVALLPCMMRLRHLAHACIGPSVSQGAWGAGSLALHARDRVVGTGHAQVLAAVATLATDY